MSLLYFEKKLEKSGYIQNYINYNKQARTHAERGKRRGWKGKERKETTKVIF